MYQFILTYQATDTEVDEPNGMQSLNSTLKRDFNSHGMFFKYIKGDLRLSFPGTARTLLENAYNNEGLDATVTLTINYRLQYTDSWLPVFVGQSVMKSREYSDYYFACDFEEINILTKIQARKSVKYNTDKLLNLDNAAMAAPTFTTLEYVGKKIRQKTAFELILNSLQYQKSGTDFLIQGGGGTWSYTLDEIEFTDKSNAIYEDGETLDDSFVFSASSYVSLLNGFEFKPEPFIGDYSVNIAMSGDWQLPVTSPVTATGATVTLVLLKYEYINAVWTLVAANSFASTTLTYGTTNSKTISTNQDYTISRKATRIVPALIFTSASNGDYITVQSSGLTFLANWDSDFPDTNIECLTIHESLNKNLEFITGETDLLYSELFGLTTDGYNSNGDFSDFLETNGYLIRGFTKSIQHNLEDRLNSLKGIFNIGHGLQRDDYQLGWQYRVEKMDYFYQDVQMIEVSDIEDDSYLETFATDLEFTKIISGYKKYAQDEDKSASLQDFNTQHEYQLPITYLIPRNDVGEEITYDITSDYIASDYLWEITRREQFAQKQTTSNKYDNDLFIVQVDGVNQLATGDSIDTITNLENSDTAFNHLINPRYNFLNHSLVINSILYAKYLSETIFNTSVINNEDFSFKYQASYTPVLGDLGRRDKAMNDNILIGENNYGERLFDPVYIEFRTGLTQDQIDEIIEGHRNGLSSNNYGYISVTDPDGTLKSGWLIELDYETVDKIAKFKLLKRADTYLP